MTSLNTTQNHLEYVKVSETLDIQGQPIVTGSDYYTGRISILIMKPSVNKI